MTDPTTPVDRLRDKITERLKLAKAAEGVPGDFMSVGFPRTPGRDAVLLLINTVANPAAVIKSCERDLRVLDRHAPQPPPEADEPARCAGCTHDNLSAWPCWKSWPCDEITDLADEYGVDLTGGTP